MYAADISIISCRPRFELVSCGLIIRPKPRHLPEYSAIIIFRNLDFRDFRAGSAISHGVTSWSFSMELGKRLQALSERIEQLKENVQTEEATKTAFIMPFINALGYDIFNPLEVVPEAVADVGNKKGEKVDYCIKVDGQDAIIVEAKLWDKDLDNHHGQVYRYFNASPAKFAILTNGIQYRFHTDLEKANILDPKPFFEFTLEQLSDTVVAELRRFQKGEFNASEIHKTATVLRYSKEVKELLRAELNSPSEDFVRYLASAVKYPRRMTGTGKEEFTALVTRAGKSLLSELVSERLKKALDSETQANDEAETVAEVVDDGIVTTEEELQGFRIVQAVLRQVVNVERITMRDSKSYFAIMLDDNNRKTICRLHLNRESAKYLGVFDAEKNETRIKIESVNDIFQHEAALVDTVKRFIEGSANSTSDSLDTAALEQPL